MAGRFRGSEGKWAMLAIFKMNEPFETPPPGSDTDARKGSSHFIIFPLMLCGFLLLCLIILMGYRPRLSTSEAPNPGTASNEVAPSGDKEILSANLETPSEEQTEVQGPYPIRDIVDLQPFRQNTTIVIKSAQGKEGFATLVNLNPNINAWYLLRFKRGEDGEEDIYHLENGNPERQRLLLDGNRPQGIVIAAGGREHVCDLWGTGAKDRLKEARKSGLPYAPLCEEQIFLRNPTKGHRTRIEKVTDFLRDEVPGGERIVVFVRDTLLKDRYSKMGKVTESKPDAEGLFHTKRDGSPAPAQLDPRQANRVLKPDQIAIQLEEPCADGMAIGTWCAVKDNPGIFFSLIVPDGIAPEILGSYPNLVSPLDSVESGQLVYLIAFDLDQFELGFGLGTEHPRVEWSDHMLDQMKDDSLPGPDGIETIAPLVATGLINPRDAYRTVATFTGGFKRSHGAFKYGNLALKNYGHHYGFIENGVVLSRLQPGLSTIYTMRKGWTDMKSWAETDNPLLPKVRYARQNGVPIIRDYDFMRQMSVPGPLVTRWGEGNWSGSVDSKLRTLRGGAALQEIQGKRFLIYAVFWSATPSAMARVFQAYSCRHAMHLDMNALEHTYMALYKREGGRLHVQHLIEGMNEVDRTKKGDYIPRFLGYSDNRDFFYVLRKEKS
jgi:hypothetical protein